MSTFVAQLAAAWPLAAWQDVTVAVAVSGGADSAALLRGMRELKVSGKGKLVAVHFNHGLRGAESDQDEVFVRELAQQLNLPILVGKGDVAARRVESADGLESAAREARYEFFATAAEVGARYVATAHTADDQAETVLQRMLRGTGIAGLAGIPRVRVLSPAVTVIRPLLTVSRAEVIEYLQSLGQPWREDASNADCSLTRNCIRHELLPALRARYNPAVDEALLRLANQARDAQAIIAAEVGAIFEQAVRMESPTRAVVECASLAGHARHLLRELFAQLWRMQNWPQQNLGFVELEQLAELVLAKEECPPITLPGAIRVTRSGITIVLEQG